MSNPSKRLGTSFETALLKHLRAEHYNAERLSLSGAQDEGDLLLDDSHHRRRFVLEAKNTKGFTPADWVRQAKVEAQNYATHRGVVVPHWAVVAKARNRPLTEAYVILNLEEWLRQIDG